MPTEPLTVMEMATANGRNRPNQDQLRTSQEALGATVQPTRKTAAGSLCGTDRATQFAAAVHAQVNGALRKCEERFPGTGHHSVLYVVLENSVAQHQRQVNRLHEEFFGHEEQDPLAPVRLEVVDRATDEALQRLLEIGLLRLASRTSRTLWPAETASAAARPLSDAELRKASGFEQRAAYKLKVVRVLTEAGLAEEARSPLLEAMLAVARKLATEQRMPEPEVLHESLLPPFSGCWGRDLSLFRRFATDPGEPCAPVALALSRLL